MRWFALAFFLALACIATPPPARADDDLFLINVKSAALTAFWHDEAFMHAEVLVPDSYRANATQSYPTIYVVSPFYASFGIDDREKQRWLRAMHDVGTEFVVVFLDARFPTGHHAFADSANNGPWGTALVQDFIPEFERQFRVLPSASNRFLTGRSSGGWATLWLQVNYPDQFGGVWAISPDPVDFRDFVGVDLTAAAPVNFYHDGLGREYGMLKRNGRDQTTLRRWVIEDTQLHFGNQFDSFDAVFSPKGPDGKPEPLFDRGTGDVHPDVAKYWEEHYDISRIIRTQWSSLGPRLHGKLHIFVGTADTFHLDEAVRLLGNELRALGSDAEVVFVPRADHFDIENFDGDIVRHDMVEMREMLTAQRRP